MTEKEIQREVDARVAFKMNELLTGIKNMVTLKFVQSVNDPREAKAWEAFNTIKGMVEKEVRMPTPYDEMAAHNKKMARDKAVESIADSILKRGTPEYYHQLNLIVAKVEAAQKF